MPKLQLLIQIVSPSRRRHWPGAIVDGVKPANGLGESPSEESESGHNSALIWAVRARISSAFFLETTVQREQKNVRPSGAFHTSQGSAD